MSLEYPFPEVPAPGTTVEVAPGIHWLSMPLPFQLDHINLWLVEEEDGWTDRGHRHRQRRDARAVGEAPRQKAGEARDRHALPPRPRRQCRLALRALRRRAVDDAGRIPDGARGAHVERRLYHRRRALGVPQERPRRGARRAHARRRATAMRSWCPSSRSRTAASSRATRSRIGRHAGARSSATAMRPSTCPCFPKDSIR